MDEFKDLINNNLNITVFLQF